MNKFYFTLVLFLGLFANASAQPESLYQFTHNYFRSDPFQGQFSQFLEHLVKDPAIGQKQTRLRSDSALFYFYGIYTNYNPFFFKPKKVEVLLEEMPFKFSDSLPASDTLLVYQLTAHGEASEAGQKEVIKEFEKIHRQYKRRFFDTNYKEFKENEDLAGAVHNYFVAQYDLSPLSIAWGNIEGTKEPVLNITVRMKRIGNHAVLPIPLYNP